MQTINNEVRNKWFIQIKNEVYTKLYDTNLILRIRDDSRKQRKIKVAGWRTTETFIEFLKDEKNWKKLF